MTNHRLEIEHESAEKLDENGLNPNRWVERRLTGYAQTSCTCGLDTGLVERPEAARVFEEHRAEVMQQA